MGEPELKEFLANLYDLIPDTEEGRIYLNSDFEDYSRGIAWRFEAGKIIWHFFDNRRPDKHFCYNYAELGERVVLAKKHNFTKEGFVIAQLKVM